MSKRNQQQPPTVPALDFLRRELALLKATQAPVIFFETGSSFGIYEGVANITLEGLTFLIVDQKHINDSHVVAHLRFPISAIPSLRLALDGITEMLKPVPEEAKN